jgi:rsbT co-antagonist protein RsbR
MSDTESLNHTDPQPPMAQVSLLTYKTLVEHALDGVAIAGLDSRIVYANNTLRSMSGLNDQIVGASFFSLHSAETQEYIQATVLPELMRSGNWRGSLDVLRPDGSIIRANLSSFMISDPTDGSTQLAAIFRDMTHEQAQAQQIEQNSERLQTLLSQLPMIVFEFGPDGVSRWTDGKGLADLGIQPNQFNGLSLYEVYKDFPEIVASIRRAAAGESFSAVIELAGQVLESRYQPLFNADGSVRSVLGISTNISERMQHEAERTRLQEELILTTQAALRELSVPLIPLADGVVLLPLIGTIDSSRAQQVLETLLEGVSAQNARTAILDITGVRVIDTQVANALLRAARAARLLGANVVLSGISPEVAQTIVHLGVDLNSIMTQSNLQRAISFALSQ